MTILETLEAQLRTAAVSRQYAEVQRLVVEYCAAARSHVGSLAPDTPEMSDAQATIWTTLEWTHRMLQAGRESIVLDLNRLPRVQRYLQTPPPDGNNWHVEG